MHPDAEICFMIPPVPILSFFLEIAGFASAFSLFRHLQKDLSRLLQTTCHIQGMHAGGSCNVRHLSPPSNQMPDYKEAQHVQAMPGCTGTCRDVSSAVALPDHSPLKLAAQMQCAGSAASLKINVVTNLLAQL